MNTFTINWTTANGETVITCTGWQGDIVDKLRVTGTWEDVGMRLNQMAQQIEAPELAINANGFGETLARLLEASGFTVHRLHPTQKG